MYGISIYLLILYPSVSISSQFSYSRSWLDKCKVCFEKSCWLPAQQACEYHSLAAAVLSSNETPSIKHAPVNTAVDDMLVDFLDTAPYWLTKDCVPLISQYTDCSKENICIGCNVCSCTIEGNWNCELVQQCRPGHRVPVDHKSLTTAIEQLKYEITRPRDKRSLKIKTPNLAPFWNIIGSFHDSKGEPDASTEDNNDKSLEITSIKYKNASTTEKSISSKISDNAIKIDNENLIFDEILNNIAVEDVAQRKPVLDEGWMENRQFINVTNFDFENIANILNDNFTNELTESVTEVYIDLLASVTESVYGKNYSSTITEETVYQKDKIKDISRENQPKATDNMPKKTNSNKIDNTVDLRFKRDTTNFLNGNESMKVIMNNNDTNNNVANLVDLQTQVFEPLNNLIEDKQKEIEDLTYIKDKITKYLKNIENNNGSIINNIGSKNETESQFSIYKVEINSDSSMSNKIMDENFYQFDKLIQKINVDILNTIADVERLKKVSINRFPEDLELVDNILKTYSGNRSNFKKDSKQLAKSDETNHIVNFFWKMLSLVDEEKTKKSSLTNGAEKIVRRIIKINHFPDDNIADRLNLNTNLTKELLKIGTDWKALTDKIATSHPRDLLSNLKLLHFSLSNNILDLTDTLSIVKFAQTRRMSVMDGAASKTLKNIGICLKEMSVAINDNINKKSQLMKTTTEPRKHSFFKKMKRIFSESKNNILRFMNIKNKQQSTFAPRNKIDDDSYKSLIEYENKIKSGTKIILTKRSAKNVY